jgi:hypothetical protein
MKLLRVSGHLVPRTAAAPEKAKVSGLDQLSEMQLQGIAVRIRERHCRGQSNSAMLPRDLQKLLIDSRKGSHQSFVLHFLRERILLVEKT